MPLAEFLFGSRSAVSAVSYVSKPSGQVSGTNQRFLPGLHPGARVQDVGPGQRPVCCFGPRHHGPAAGLQVQRGAGAGEWSQRGPGGCR